jgi:hypothetical protein
MKTQPICSATKAGRFLKKWARQVKDLPTVEMHRISLVLLLVIFGNEVFSQTCTVTGTSPLNWANPGPNCQEGGNAGGKSILVIPAGFTLRFDSNGDTWTGTRIDVYGTLLIDKDVTINSSITVYNGGNLILQSKLSMGTSSGCGYGLSIRPGAVVDVGGTGSDRLSICGKELMKGNGACNSCGGTNSGTCNYNGNPYCEPTGGFAGPLGYDEDGYDVVLPIKLASITAHSDSEAVCLDWSTASEKNFDYFVVEASTDGVKFDSIGVIEGHGDSKELLKYSYSHQSPMIGKNYYRLKSVDHDSTYEYSPVVVAVFNGNKIVTVYPNPTIGPQINVRTNFAPQEADRIEIYNNIGLKLMEYDVSDYESALQFGSDMKAGTYILRYVSRAHTQLVRFTYH